MGGGRKNLNFSNEITEILATQNSYPGEVLGEVPEREKPIVATKLPKLQRSEERENRNCGNQVAENVREKKNCGNQGCPSNQMTRPTQRFRPDLTRPSHRSAMGHLFQKPTLVGQSRFSSPKPKKTQFDRCIKNSKQKISRFRQKFPEFNEIFQIPTPNFQIPASNFQILATNFHISATYQVDLVIFCPNLMKSHRIQRDLTISSQISTGFGVFSPEINYFGQIFHCGRFRPNRLCFWCKTDCADPIPRRSAAGQDFLNLIISGWAQT